MKRLVSSLVFIIMAASVTQAQNFRFGVGAGMDAARMALSGASGGPLVYRTELAGGISGEAVISKTFSVQLEANYDPQGAGVINADGSTAGSYQLDYVTVPLMAKLYGTPELSFLVGPQVGFLVNGKTKTSGSADVDVKDMLESTSFYAVFGAEYRFKNGVFVSGRYNAALSNSVKDETTNTEIKNRYMSFRIGYSFAF